MAFHAHHPQLNCSFFFGCRNILHNTRVLVGFLGGTNTHEIAKRLAQFRYKNDYENMETE